jgi:hypothetical protein
MNTAAIVRVENVPTLQGFVLVYEGSAEHAEFLALASVSADAASPTDAPKKPRGRK